jgi:hypothetical protein
MFLAEWQATQPQIPTLTGHWQTDCLLQHLGEDQTGDSQKETHQCYIQGVPKPQSAHVGGFQQFRCQCVCVCVEIQFYARMKHISTLVLSIWSQLQASDCHSTSVNNQHYLLLSCQHAGTGTCENHPSCFSLLSELPFDWEMQMISYSVTCSLDHSSGAVFLSTVTKNLRKLSHLSF